MNKDTLNSLLEPNKKSSSVPDTIVAPELTSTKYLPMLNGTATNTLAIIGRNAEPTRINPLADNEATIENGDFKVFIEKYSNKKSLKVGVVKLLDFLAVGLAKNNH